LSGVIKMWSPLMSAVKSMTPAGVEISGPIENPKDADTTPSRVSIGGPNPGLDVVTEAKPLASAAFVTVMLPAALTVLVFAPSTVADSVSKL
jgi:hypothetical protein